LPRRSFSEGGVFVLSTYILADFLLLVNVDKSDVALLGKIKERFDNIT
jgi:hypothetical protein